MQKILLILLTISLASLNADTLFIYKTSRPYSSPHTEISKVSKEMIRVERGNILKRGYKIIDTDEQKVYTFWGVVGKNLSPLVMNLDHKNYYNGVSTLQKVGDGPELLDQIPTTHYLFKTGDTVCSHIYIAEIKNPDIGTFLENFIKVPIGYDNDPVKCASASVDVAKSIKKLGIPLLIKDTDNNKTLFEIISIKKTIFKEEKFEIPEKIKLQMEDISQCED